jgi:hypothetical protein
MLRGNLELQRAAPLLPHQGQFQDPRELRRFPTTNHHEKILEMLELVRPQEWVALKLPSESIRVLQVVPDT